MRHAASLGGRRETWLVLSACRCGSQPRRLTLAKCARCWQMRPPLANAPAAGDISPATGTPRQRGQRTGCRPGEGSPAASAKLIAPIARPARTTHSAPTRGGSGPVGPAISPATGTPRQRGQGSGRGTGKVRQRRVHRASVGREAAVSPGRFARSISHDSPYARLTALLTAHSPPRNSPGTTHRTMTAHGSPPTTDRARTAHRATAGCCRAHPVRPALKPAPRRPGAWSGPG